MRSGTEEILVEKEIVMPVPIRIVLLILCLAFFAYIVRLVSRKKLLLKYSLLWMALSVLLICCVIIPEPILGVASIMGIQVASNFIFIVAILCLLAISLSLSIIASRQAAYSKTLVQEVALLENEIEKLKHSQFPCK